MMRTKRNGNTMPGGGVTSGGNVNPSCARRASIFAMDSSRQDVGRVLTRLRTFSNDRRVETRPTQCASEQRSKHLQDAPQTHDPDRRAQVRDADDVNGQVRDTRPEV